MSVTLLVMRTRPLAVAAAAIMLVLAACSGSSSKGAASSSSSGSTAAATTVAAPTTAAPTTTTEAPTTSAAPTTTTSVPPRTVAAVLAMKRTIVLAHAAGEDAHPHSTPYGYAASVKEGVDLLDLDVQLTKDGVLIVQHDDSVDRTTGSTGKVAGLTFDQVHALDNAYWFTASCTCKGQPDAAYVLRGMRTGEKAPLAGYTPDDFAVPRFRDIATRFPGFVLNIEIKGTFPAAVPAANELAKELTELGRLDAAVVTSFDDKVLAAFHAAAPTVEQTPGLAASTAFVLQKLPLPAGMRILQLPPVFNRVAILTPDVLARAKAAGYPIWVWPNDSALETVAGYKGFIAEGIEGLNAAQPALAVQAVRGG